jgi:hypothetical protein
MIDFTIFGLIGGQHEKKRIPIAGTCLSSPDTGGVFGAGGKEVPVVKLAFLGPLTGRTLHRAWREKRF